MSRTLRSLVLASVFVGACPGLAAAESAYLTAFRVAYPSSTLPDRMFTATGSSCNVCHQPPSRATAGNCYKIALAGRINAGRTVQQALADVALLDSDGDGVSNQVEILAPRPDGGIGYNPGLIGPTGTDPCGASPNAPVSNANETPCGAPSLTGGQPQSATACPTAGATFTVTPAGSGTFVYQWKFESPETSGVFVNLTNAGFVDAASGLTFNVAGAGASSLGISNIHIGSHGSALRFEAVVTAACGTGTTSSVAVLTICPADFNCDGNVNPDDLGDFITCYFTTPPCAGADFNADSDVNPDDLGDFITTYFGPTC